jgi:hypothetical protein
MDTRLLGKVLQPFCGKCCGEHNARGNRRQKQQARAQQKRETQQLIEAETDWEV